MLRKDNLRLFLGHVDIICILAEMKEHEEKRERSRWIKR
jgi:hypothetical protein